MNRESGAGLDETLSILETTRQDHVNVDCHAMDQEEQGTRIGEFRVEVRT